MYGRIPVFMRLQRFAEANATGKGGLSLVILHFQKLAFKTRRGEEWLRCAGDYIQ